MIKALAFDLDGTLAEMKEFHKLALNRSLKELCSYEISDELHYTILDGLSTKQKIEYLIKNNYVTDNINAEEINQLKQKYTIEYIKYLQPSDNHIAMMESIDLPKCCVTNSIRETATLILKQVKLFDYFDFILTNQDISHPKPHPMGYLLAANRFRIRPEEMLVVEDNPHGVQAATNAGNHVLSVENPDVLDIWVLSSKIEEINTDA